MWSILTRKYSGGTRFKRGLLSGWFFACGRLFASGRSSAGGRIFTSGRLIAAGRSSAGGWIFTQGCNAERGQVSSGRRSFSGGWFCFSRRTVPSGRGFSRTLGKEAGQTAVEYILVLAVVLTMFMLVAKPFLGDFAKKFEEAGKKGFFAEDPTGANFYYYPLPRN